jgi:hypothetical protein
MDLNGTVNVVLRCPAHDKHLGFERVAESLKRWYLPTEPPVPGLYPEDLGGCKIASLLGLAKTKSLSKIAVVGPSGGRSGSAGRRMCCVRLPDR